MRFNRNFSRENLLPKKKESLDLFLDPIPPKKKKRKKLR